MSSTAIVRRSDQVLAMMKEAKKNLVNNFFDLGELLSEFRANNYHTDFGFARFGDFIESQDWLDMKERQAYYLIKIVDTGRELGLSSEDLRSSKVSKLKEIFSLDKQENCDTIRELVAKSKDMSLDEVTQEVQKIKKSQGIEPRIVVHLGFSQTTYDNVVAPAIERARDEYGSTVDSSGEIMDISDSRAVELILADYLAQPEDVQDVIPAESVMDGIVYEDDCGRQQYGDDCG